MFVDADAGGKVKPARDNSQTITEDGLRDGSLPSVRAYSQD